MIMAEFARDQLKLDSVLWMIAAEPPHKTANSITGIKHRLEMVKLVIKNRSEFAISLLDMNRPGPHFSSDMLELASRELPETELYFLIGSDSLHDLPRWYQPERLGIFASICVMDRSGKGLDAEDVTAEIPSLRGNIQTIVAPTIGISATSIRERVRRDQTIRYLVPDSVCSYIHKHRLYR